MHRLSYFGRIGGNVVAVESEQGVVALGQVDVLMETEHVCEKARRMMPRRLPGLRLWAQYYKRC